MRFNLQMEHYREVIVSFPKISANSLELPGANPSELDPYYELKFTAE